LEDLEFRVLYIQQYQFGKTVINIEAIDPLLLIGALHQTLTGCVPLGSEIQMWVVLIRVRSLRIDSIRVIGLGVLHDVVRACDSVPTFKTFTGAGRVVAYALVGAVHLA